jgi:hypothetical protein
MGRGAPPRTDRFTRDRPGTRCREGWVVPQRRSEQMRRMSPLSPPGLDPRTVQPVASRHGDCGSY